MVASGGRNGDDGGNGSSSNAAIATITWEHSYYISMTPVDRTFDLVIDTGALECVMCYSDQTERRMNMYSNEVERVLMLVGLEDEDGDSDNNKGGKGRVVQQRRR